MQNRYAGDVGDFLKCGLLRWLCTADASHPALHLGRPGRTADVETTMSADEPAARPDTPRPGSRFPQAHWLLPRFGLAEVPL